MILHSSLFTLRSSLTKMNMRQRRRNRLAHDGEDDDPMSVVSNLFDVAMVFALALMVALVSRYNMTEMFSKDNFTMVKSPG